MFAVMDVGHQGTSVGMPAVVLVGMMFTLVPLQNGKRDLKPECLEGEALASPHLRNPVTSLTSGKGNALMVLPADSLTLSPVLTVLMGVAEK